MTGSSFSFYPSVRAGYRPASEFSKGETAVDDPGTARVDLDITASGPDGERAAAAGVDLTIYGPGEVTNLDENQVVRVEPSPDTTSFPPNYFPLVEFDSPELPWVFSPQRADAAGRNRPWLCLVVVPRSRVEFQATTTGPLPVLETPTDQLPDAEETWAWAHAQIVGEEASRDPEATFASRSTATVSRLLCPRNLDGETKYRACVVPTFEPGRRAGLGLDPYPDGRSSMSVAWTDEASVRLPVYYHWRFTTSEEGDFESLVEELKPVELGDDVGFRTVDASDPGPTELKLPADPATDRGTVGIGGALTAIGATPDPYDADMQTTLRDLLNDPGGVVQNTDYGAVGPPLYGQYHAGVPYLEPESMDTEEYYYPQWFNDLNVDPRYRIAAGYGTAVIRAEQGRLMDSAWDQFGDLDGLNEYLNRMRLAEAVLLRRHETLDTYSTGTLVGMTSPLHGVLEDDEGRGRTLQGTVAGTDLPGGLASPAFRRLTRPTGPIARQPVGEIDPESVSLRVETGRVPRVDDLEITTETVGEVAGETAVAAAGTIDDVAEVADPGAGPSESSVGSAVTAVEDGSDGAGSNSSRTTEPDVERLLTAIDGLETHVERANRSVTELEMAIQREDAETVRKLVERRPTVVDRCESIGRNTFDPLSRAVAKVLARPRPDGLPESFDRATASEHLRDLHESRRQVESGIQSAIEALDAGDGARAVRQRLDRVSGALAGFSRTASQLRSAVESGRVDGPLDTAGEAVAQGFDGDLPEETPSRVELARPQTVDLPDPETLRSSILSGLDPSGSLPELAGRRTGLGNLFERDDPIDEVLAAPSFDEPTAELLAELNQEYFLPGAEDVPRDSIGMLETNPEFVESFLVGLNHEFARELQWRNFPTDRRGSYFRRFWDRRIDDERSSTDTEGMSDVAPLHTWDENALGENTRHSDGSEVVLLVRGELLRRYPNTAVFAAKAIESDSETDDDGPDRVPALPESPVTRDDAGPNITFPQFRGRLEPDMTYFGFDLSPEEALYDPYHERKQAPDDHPNEGWFFVFQEPPAETRFGLDQPGDDPDGRIPAGIESTDGSTPRPSEGDRDPTGWADLSWAHLTDGAPEDVRYVDVDGSRPGRENWWYSADRAGVSDGEAAQWGYNSAHMARITWQLPARVSIHADDMIPESDVRPKGGGR